MNLDKWKPHVHEVEPDRSGWRCLATGCHWTGNQQEAIRHAVKHQWSDPGVRAVVTNAERA